MKLAKNLPINDTMLVLIYYSGHGGINDADTYGIDIDGKVIDLTSISIEFGI